MRVRTLAVVLVWVWARNFQAVGAQHSTNSAQVVRDGELEGDSYDEFEYDDDDDDDYVIDEEEEQRMRAQALHDKALDLAMAGKEHDSLSLFAQAASLAPDNMGFQSDLGVTQMRLGLLDEAKASFLRADSIQPGTQLVSDNLKALQEHLDFREEQNQKRGGASNEGATESIGEEL